MNASYTFYTYVLFLTAFISLIIGYMAWKKRPARGAIPLFIMSISVSIWALFQALAFVSEDINIKLFFSNMKYFGIEITPLCFYVVAYAYSDEILSFTIRKRFLFSFTALLFIAALWTNPLHHKFYLTVTLLDGILFLKSGPIFWINMLYLYYFIIAGIYFAIKTYIRSASVYRKQSLIIVLAALSPLLSNLAFNFKFLPFRNIDITPVSLLISGILFFYALFQYRFLELIPVARNKLIEEMDDIVIVLDNSRKILDLNKKAKELILKDTINSENYLGSEISSLLADWKDLLDIILDSDEVSNRVTYSTPAETRYFDVKISYIYDNRKKVSGKFIVLRDITQLEKALLETKNAKEAAEQANMSKGYFLANMSHEIRTPMNAILGIAEILDTTDMPREEQKRYIKIISNSAESLLTIINDILDLSKIEAGKMEIEKVDFELVKLLNEAVETFKIFAFNKSLELKLYIDNKLENHFIGDPVRIRQILINLIGNAIKFTNEGSIEVVVEQMEISNNQVWVSISVKDSGIGIAEEKLSNIFENFKQADSSTTRKFGGTGLGLSIAKNLIELMGGTIRVESEFGRGSVFSFTVPLEICNKEMKTESIKGSTQSNSINLSGFKILVVDDNKLNREVIYMYLKKTGCEMEFAENGTTALQMYEDNDYDLILMDIQMPEMDGLEVTRRIRVKERVSGQHTPIIALTAGAMKDDVENCLKSGMDAHISKPVKSEKLLNAIVPYLIKNEPAEI